MTLHSLIPALPTYRLAWGVDVSESHRPLIPPSHHARRPRTDVRVASDRFLLARWAAAGLRGPGLAGDHGLPSGKWHFGWAGVGGRGGASEAA